VCKLGLVALLLAAAPVMTGAQTRVAVEGTAFVLALPDSRLLRSTDLMGATLTISAQSTRLEVTIASVEEDPDATGGRVMLHRFLVKNASGGQRDLCTPDAQGRHHGFPVPDGRGGFALTCTSGAVGSGLSPEACTEDRARRDPAALLFNRSYQ